MQRASTAAIDGVACGVVWCRVAVAWRGVAAHAPCTNTVGGCPRTNQRARTCAPRTPGGTHHQGWLLVATKPPRRSPSPRRPPAAATAPTSLTSGASNEQYKCAIWSRRPR